MLSKIDIIIGKNIKSIRKNKNLSQADLAEMVDITFQQIQKYEKGINRISASRLYLMAEKLNIPITDFFIEGYE